jgi:hypothetical protein
MSRKRKRTRRGHYCWACQRDRANERFSGPGHARHLCRDCAKLGPAELAYRQALHDLHRCLTFDGRVRRTQRKTFEPRPKVGTGRARRPAAAIPASTLKDGTTPDAAGPRSRPSAELLDRLRRGKAQLRARRREMSLPETVRAVIELQRACLPLLARHRPLRRRERVRDLEP